jgi:hypothetical protein
MKKLERACIFFSILAIITGCSEKDQTVKDQTLKFKFIINENYIRENESKWVLVYNKSNVLVSEKELMNNSEIELTWESDTDDSLYTIQIIRALIDDNDESYEIFTYTDVEPDTWKLNGAQVSEQPVAIGSNKISFTDFDISDYYNHLISNLGHGNGYQYNNTFTLTQHYNPDKIWMIFYNENEAPFYRLLNNVTLNQEIVLSLNDLVPMENYIDYELPMANYCGVYLNADQVFENNVNPHFLVYNLFHYESSNSIRVYYPGNLFSSYNFDLIFRVDNVFETMVNKGPTPPAEIIRMNITEEINADKIENFNSAFTGEAEYTDHIWEYCIYDNQNGDKIFRYHVYSAVLNSFNFNAPELPFFFTELNSNLLKLTNLELDETVFYQIDNSNDYKDFITKTFINPESANNYTRKLIKDINN